MLLTLVVHHLYFAVFSFRQILSLWFFIPTTQVTAVLVIDSEEQVILLRNAFESNYRNTILSHLLVYEALFLCFIGHLSVRREIFLWLVDHFSVRSVILVAHRPYLRQEEVILVAH